MKEQSWRSLAGYTPRDDGTFAKTIVLEWGITRKCQSTETLVRSATGKLLSVEGRAKRRRNVKRAAG